MCQLNGSKIIFRIGRIHVYRALVLVGFAFALLSLQATLSHIANPDYLVADVARGETHAWYHFFREAIGDMAAISGVLILLFGPSKYRSPLTWCTMVVVLFGYFSPYWIGYPWHGVSSPNVAAEAAHILQTGLTFAGVLMAKRDYFRVGVD